MLNHQNLIEDLNNLPNKSGSISVSAQIARHFEAIDKAFKLGVSQREIVETLQRNGLQINNKSFPTTWARLKKRFSSDGLRTVSKSPHNPTLIESESAEVISSETVYSAKPSTIDEIIKATPDLKQLAKLSKGRK